MRCSRFSPELRNVLYLLNLGVANEDDAGLKDGTPAETRIADIQCALDELVVFCAYVVVDFYLFFQKQK